MVSVTCLGGAGSVTGSCYLVENSLGKRVLVDCGLFRGNRRTEMRNRRSWCFDPAGISAVLLTHAHIGHCGRIPKLQKDGFEGDVFATGPTASLSGVMLEDEAYIQEHDALWHNKKNRRANQEEVRPLFSAEDARRSMTLFREVVTGAPIEVAPGIRACFRRAGHIIGSSIIELWAADTNNEIKMVFSGDIGKNAQLVDSAPEVINEADCVFVESTFGDRNHASIDAGKTELLDAVGFAVSNGEKVIIPSLTLSRTREILQMLFEFHSEGLLPEIPVFLDSPIAERAISVLMENGCFIGNNGLDNFELPGLRYAISREESMAVNEYEGPAIVIAGSGMCDAGRIKHHLVHNLWRPGSSIVFIGFQAAGTTGRMIVDGRKWVKIFWRDVAVRARIFTIGTVCAHADQEELLGWVNNFRRSNPRIFVVHGEHEASRALASEISSRFGMEAIVPSWRARFRIGQKKITAEGVGNEAESRSVAVKLALRDVERELELLKVRLEKPQADDDIVQRLRMVENELRCTLAD